MPLTPLPPVTPSPAVPPPRPLQHSPGGRWVNSKFPENSKVQASVFGCRQLTHPEPLRFRCPRLRVAESLNLDDRIQPWGWEDTGLPQRWVSPQLLAHPEPKPSGKISLPPGQREEPGRSTGGAGLGSPGASESSLPRLPLPTTYLAVAETVYDGDKKSLWGGERRGS